VKIEEVKQEMKEKYARAVDAYFERYTEGKSNGRLDIDGIEELLGNGIAEAKDILISTTEELIKPEKRGESKKKPARPAKER